MIFEILSPTVEAKQFWDSVQWGLIFLCVISGYWFTQSILPAKHMAKVPRWLLFVFPVIFMATLISNPILIYPNEGILKGRLARYNAIVAKPIPTHCQSHNRGFVRQHSENENNNTDQQSYHDEKGPAAWPKSGHIVPLIPSASR